MTVSNFNKKKVLSYCEKFVRTDFSHLCAAQDNFRAIKAGKYEDLVGCPSSFGLDDYVGLCETETVEGYAAQCKQCEACWKRALGVGEKNDQRRED